MYFVSRKYRFADSENHAHLKFARLTNSKKYTAYYNSRNKKRRKFPISQTNISCTQKNCILRLWKQKLNCYLIYTRSKNFDHKELVPYVSIFYIHSPFSVIADEFMLNKQLLLRSQLLWVLKLSQKSYTFWHDRGQLIRKWTNPSLLYYCLNSFVRCKYRDIGPASIYTWIKNFFWGNVFT